MVIMLSVFVNCLFLAILRVMYDFLQSSAVQYRQESTKVETPGGFVSINFHGFINFQNSCKSLTLNYLFPEHLFGQL